MRYRWLAVAAVLGTALSAPAMDANRLAYLDEFCDPYYAGLETPRLTTPQWIGESGVEAVIVLSNDDLREPARHENYLRPVIERLKRIDGRGPVSLMANRADPEDAQLQAWLREGLSIEAHTYDHPCPCLQKDDFARSKATYDRAVDMTTEVPNNRPVAFRMPCCDSMNSVSPRFFAEIFCRTTPAGRFLAIDSSVFQLFTPCDPELPRELVFDPDGRERFRKYVLSDRQMVNYVEDYPYPYAIARLCWEIPCLMPGDWVGQHLNGLASPETLADMKAGIDLTVLKQGIFVLCFHSGGWMSNAQAVELVDYAQAKYGRKVKFLNFREVRDLLTKNLLGGQPLRAANGQDNGVRVLDLNYDGFMDVVVGNEQLRQTRLFSPKTGNWTTSDFPVQIVTVDEQGNRRPAGVRFGVMRRTGHASLIVRNERVAGTWHFNGARWLRDPRGLGGLDGIDTARQGRDRGVRLRDLDLDGVCELIVGNPDRQAVYAWSADERSWNKLPFTLPGGATVVDAQGRDAGLRLVDVDEDGRLDVVFSDARRYRLNLFVSMAEGWSRQILEGTRPGNDEIPPIVRADGTNNGAWFAYRHIYVQNEQTGAAKPNHIESRAYTTLLDGDVEPPARSPEGSLRSLILRPGFKAELMAAEPLVMDPIDIAWGPDGKAWVVEMADYPLGMSEPGHIGPPQPLGQPGGRIRFLEDTDGDGRYDKSTVFLEPVGFPSGVMPWRKGVIITAAPETFYAEDTDGDGRADVRRTLFSGFREGNQQHRVNHPRWGLDNWVYLANGDSGGQIKSARTGQVVNISGRDLRVRPDEGLLDPQAGQTQYGRNRDDWGNWFGCNNSNPGWHYAVADHYMRRNPHVAAPPNRVDLAADRKCFPAGRVITHCYIAQPTPPEGTPGRWTSVAGVMVYRDELFGPQYTGNVFVEDSVYNVVHRMILRPEGFTFRGERAPDEERSEFLGSADPWFRPATLRTGPDGALWITDMYRFVIEHPEWIVPELTNQLELRRYSDRGRIYRVYPVDKEPRPIPRLDKLDTAGLVAALDSPNGWQRDMAQQMLIWRADEAAVPLLEKMAAGSRRALARLHALCTLDGLGALRPEIVIRGLADEHPGVRRHAVRLSESLVGFSPPLGEALLKRVDDEDAQVRLQLAYSLGEWPDARAGKALVKLAAHDAKDPYMTAAVLSSAVPHVETMLAELKSGSGKKAARDLADRLRKLAADIKSEPEWTAGGKEGGSLVRPIEPDRQEVERLLGGIATVEEIRQAMDKYDPVRTMYGDSERGRKMFVEATCSTCHRYQDIGEQIGPDLETLIDRSPKTLLVAVIDPNRACIDRYVEYVALSSDGLTHSGMLLEETSNSITLVDVDGNRKVLLRKDLDELIFTGRSHMPEGLQAKMNLRQMADLFAFVGGYEPPPKQFAGNHPEVVVRGQDTAFSMPVSAAAIYGNDVRFDARAGCVTSWTSPRAHVAWTFRNFVRQKTYDVWIEYACGDGAAGAPFLLQLSNGQAVEAAVAGTGGWDQYQEVRLGQVKFGAGQYRLAVRPGEPLAGELMHLRAVRLVPAEPQPDAAPTAPKPKLIKPRADGSLALRAADCQARGAGIRLHADFLVWFYKGPKDRAVWSVEVPEPGAYEVWVEWAQIDEYAGNPIAIEVEGSSNRVTGKLASTGGWGKFRKEKFGVIPLDAGQQRIVLRPDGPTAKELSDLRGLELVPATAGQ